MSFDRRLRDGLEQAAAPISPHVETSLRSVLSRRRRRAHVRRATLAIAAAGLAAAVPLAGAPILDRLQDDREQSTTATTTAQQLAGTYEVTLTDAEGAQTEPPIAGTWRMRLQPDGAAVVSAPDTFQAEQNPRGESFRADATTIRTNIFFNNFCSSIGTYTWRLVGSQLTLEARDDPCAIRRTLLETRPWTKTG